MAKGARWGGEGGGALEARNPGTTARASFLLPQKILNTQCHVLTKTKTKKPSEIILWAISCQSFVQAREAPVNDKATEASLA